MCQKKQVINFSRIFVVFEVFLVFSLTMSYIWILRSHLRYFWTIPLTIIIISQWFSGDYFRQLQFNPINFKKSVVGSLPAVFIICVLLFILSIVCGWMKNITITQTALNFSTYLIWAPIQQFVFNGYFVLRLETTIGTSYSRLVALVAAILFAMIHLPNPFLMGVTFIGGYIAAIFYLKYRDLYSLGLAHAILGTILNITLPYWITHGLVVGPNYFR